MKKMFMSLSIILSMILMLTSCDVHFGSKHYDVAWWVIAIPVCLFSMIMLYAGGKHISNHEFVCPECNKTFHPKWWVAALSLHINDNRYFKCPHCHHMYK